MNLADIQRQMNGTTTTSQTLSTVELITMPSFKVVANNPTYIEVLWFNENTLCVEQHRIPKESPLINLSDNAILMAIVRGLSTQVG